MTPRAFKQYDNNWVAECRKLGIGDLTVGRRPLSEEKLTKDDWRQVYFALLSFQCQLKLIVAHRRAAIKENKR